MILGVKWLPSLGTTEAIWEEQLLIFKVNSICYNVSEITPSSEINGPASFQHLATDSSIHTNLPSSTYPPVTLSLANPPNVRPYLYLYHLKTIEIEKQVPDLLLADFNKPSNSPFASSVFACKEKRQYPAKVIRLASAGCDSARLAEFWHDRHRLPGRLRYSGGQSR